MTLSLKAYAKENTRILFAKQELTSFLEQTYLFLKPDLFPVMAESAFIYA